MLSKASISLSLRILANIYPTMCGYMMLKWYCEECGAWYTSDEVKIEDCDVFDDTGECDQRDLVREEESDAGGLCDDCTREHDADA
ncbi:hypothetical protein F4818DRAFT_430651 [Hypoxylon cercidicola]|nr:hypothetical protein F4818DRAFT_430651 [Hypoxylon cercidicola]